MGRIIDRRRVAGAVVLAVAVLTSACGGDSASENAAEKLAERTLEDASGGDVDVDVDGDQVTIESSEGTITAGTGEVPESFPDDITLPEGTILSAIDAPSGSVVTLEVDDALAAFDDAVADLEGAGWTREQLTEAGETRVAMFSKDSEQAMVMADAGSGQVTYTVGAG